MAHYHFTYYKNGEIVNSYDSENVDTFNHAYDLADFAIRFFTRDAKSGEAEIVRTENKLTASYISKWNGAKIAYCFDIFG